MKFEDKEQENVDFLLDIWIWEHARESRHSVQQAAGFTVLGLKRGGLGWTFELTMT